MAWGTVYYEENWCFEQEGMVIYCFGILRLRISNPDTRINGKFEVSDELKNLNLQIKEHTTLELPLRKKLRQVKDI